jgi:hypothetical protein
MGSRFAVTAFLNFSNTEKIYQSSSHSKFIPKLILDISFIISTLSYFTAVRLAISFHLLFEFFAVVVIQNSFLKNEKRANYVNIYCEQSNN